MNASRQKILRNICMNDHEAYSCVLTACDEYPIIKVALIIKEELIGLFSLPLSIVCVFFRQQINYQRLRTFIFSIHRYEPRSLL